MDTIEKLNSRFLELTEAFENGEDDEQLVYDFEEIIQDAYHQFDEDNDIDQLEKLQKKVKAFKREYDFYDADVELDRMFPNRNDDDFDEDQMTWDSVFGDD